MTKSMIDLFGDTRRVSVPIVAVRSPDQACTVEIIAREHAKHVICTWDAARGLVGANKNGSTAIKAIKAGEETADFVQAMIAVGKLPKGSIVCCYNANRQLYASEPLAVASNVQAVSNLRDVLKMDHRTLVLMGPSFIAPPELEHDIIVLDHEFPNSDELATVVNELHKAAKLDDPSQDEVDKAVDAVSGLSLFCAEQVVAMSLTKQGLDHDALWERKRTTIEQTRGLRVWRGTERFDDLVGLNNIKNKLTRRIHAKSKIGVVLFLDEIDKVLANVEHDTSGVRMDQFRTLLTHMEDHEWRGSVAVGVPGSGKSAIAKAFGAEAGVPTIALDLGDMEAPHVGESEALVRRAMAIIEAIGRGNAYVIATSNNASVMRPELQRRFTDGCFFFDVMTQAEREACWQAYRARYEIPELEPIPADEGWTPAEIRNCCREAFDTGCTLVEAARHIVPMAQSRADEIEKLRRYANGRFLDATSDGPYVYNPKTMEKMSRAISLDDLPSHANLVKEVGNA